MFPADKNPKGYCMKINVRQVLSESASFYKGNFKNLAGISLAVIVFTALNQITGYAARSLFTDRPFWLTLFSFLILAVSILQIILMPKLYMAILILIDSLLDNNKITVRQAYRQTKGKYWLMAGCSIAVALFCIPAILITFTKIPFASGVSKISFALISSLFYALFPMIAIEQRKKRYIRKSVKLIKGNYFAVLALALVTDTFLDVIKEVLIYIFQNNTITVNILYSAAYFFVYPFANIAAVIVYRRLKENHKRSKPE